MGSYFKRTFFETRLGSPRPRESTFREGGVMKNLLYLEYIGFRSRGFSVASDKYQRRHGGTQWRVPGLKS